MSEQLFQQASHNFNSIFEEVQRLSYQLLTNKKLKSSSTPMKNSEKMSVCSIVSDYILNSRYIEELGLYSEKEDIMIYSDGTIKPDLYYDRVYKYDGFTTEDFYGISENLVQPAAMVKIVKNMWTDEKETLTIFAPLSGSAFQMAVFQIRMEDIMDIASELVDEEKDACYLYYNGKLIFSNKEDAVPGIEMKDNAQEVQLLSWENVEKNKIIRSAVKGKRLEMMYTPDDSLLQVFMHRDLSGDKWSASSLIYLYVTFTVVLMLISCIVVILIWRGNYRPVEEMLDYLPNGKEKRENEFDIVKNTLLSIQSENAKMSQNLHDSIPAYKKDILVSLIKGEFENLEEFNAKAAEVGMTYRNKTLFIIAAAIVDGNHSVKIRKTAVLEKMLNQSEKQMPEQMVCYGFVDRMNEKLIYVGNSDWKEEQSMEMALAEFQRNITESVGFELSIGVSNLYQKPEDMSKAYMEALSALDYRIVYGHGKIIYFSQLGLNNYSHNWYPEELTRKFRIALKTRNEEQVHVILDEIMENLYHNNTPVYVAKYVCYDLMQMLADSLVVNRSLPYKKTIGYHNIMNIARVSTFEQITEILHQNVNYVLAIDVKEETDNINQELKEWLKQFIEENYSDSNFSMASMVEAFGVSESTMRKNFKAVMQTTFIEYLAEKRIAKSKELLSSTELSLSHIAQQVGYMDTSSFIRRFRQKTGMSPGEYRIINKS